LVKNSASAGGVPIDPAAIGTTARRARLAAIRLDQMGGRREDDMIEPKRHFLRSCVCCGEPPA
jgi:hypothetical protein